MGTFFLKCVIYYLLVFTLRPNEEKLCFSAVFEMDDNAQVKDRWFGRTVINSDKRFTYEDAQQVIETGKGDFKDEILLLNDIALRSAPAGNHISAS